MNRYEEILQKLRQWGESDERLHAAIIIGSQARADHPADDSSDLDLILIVEDPAEFLRADGWLQRLGDPRISFVEDTLGGEKERRALFGGGLDVDIVLLSPSSARIALEQGAEILERGYRVLFDKIGLSFPALSAGPRAASPMTEEEFLNTVQDFWYHTVWAARKILRGELWTAKFCVDDYLKWKLLSVARCLAHAIHGLEFDTWHGGRFFEEWAEDWIVARLPDCFGPYQLDGLVPALLATMKLFHDVAAQAAQLRGFAYPEQADRFANEWVCKLLNDLY